MEVTAHYELLLHEAGADITQEESTAQQQTDSLLTALPELTKNLIRKGWPLIAHWPTDGILSLALVYQEDKFSIIPDNELPQQLTDPASPLAG